MGTSIEAVGIEDINIFTIYYMNPTSVKWISLFCLEFFDASVFCKHTFCL